MVENNITFYKRFTNVNLFFFSFIEYVVLKKFSSYQQIEKISGITKEDFLKSMSGEKIFSLDEIKSVAKLLICDIHVILNKETKDPCDYILYRNNESLESILGLLRLYLSENDENVKQKAILLINMLACDIDETKGKFFKNRYIEGWWRKFLTDNLQFLDTKWF